MQFLVRLLFCLALPVWALAADLPPPLQNLAQQGGKVVRSFPVPDGLTGWVVQLQGRSMILYTTAGGDYAFTGPLLDKDGNNLTSRYADQYIPEPDAEKLAQGLAADTSLVDEGSPRAPLVYVYADPNCSYCNKLWTELRPYVEGGKLHVRWALVDFLKRTSKGRAGAILAADDRAAALAQDEQRFDHGQEEGGIPELRPVPLDLDAALKLHDLELRDSGNMGTPTLLFRRGGSWNFNYGLPQDLPKLLASLDTNP
ncbi:MAG TPA: thiol:disulfide interchange protein DsbG [Gammaproteobacteria bacterium]|nr:thiol:disulfide interchange protein DsbG [Gammaproteobacteria bacterium]